MTVHTARFTADDCPVRSTDNNWVCIYKTPVKALAHEIVEIVGYYFGTSDNFAVGMGEVIKFSDIEAHESYYHDWEVWVKKPVTKTVANKMVLLTQGIVKGWVARGRVDFEMYHKGTPG